MRVPSNVTALCAIIGLTAGMIGCSYDWAVESLDTGPGDSETEEADSATELEPNESHPCFGMVCDTPPASVCSGTDELTIHGPDAWCVLVDTDTSLAVCRYANRVVPCASGGCLSGADHAYCEDHPCEGLDCHSIPARVCGDGSTLEVPHRFGRCAVGDTDSAPSCIFSTTAVDCGAPGCAPFDTDSDTAAFAEPAGCVDDPCLHRICNTPPPRHCDGDRLVLFEPLGRCGDDLDCVYISRAVDCGAGGCSDGRCNADPCAFVTCRRPPANFCRLGGLQLRSYSPAGACVVQDGLPVCVYTGSNLPCTSPRTCIDGRCETLGPTDTDDCIGVTGHCIHGGTEPPGFVPLPFHCRDASTIVGWDLRDGQCTDGVCLFDYNAETGIPCVDGTVSQSPCGQALCVGGPAPHCLGDTLVTYPSAGSCIGDNWCHFEPQLTSCGGGCDPLVHPLLGSCF